MTNINQLHKQGIDQPDTPISVTGGSIIFDSGENNKPPWTITCCCVERNCERSLLVSLLHYGVVLLVVTTSIVILIFRHNENKSGIGIFAILAACLGDIIISQRQWTKLLTLILTAFLRSLAQWFVKNSSSRATFTTASPFLQTHFWTIFLFLYSLSTPLRGTPVLPVTAKFSSMSRSRSVISWQSNSIKQTNPFDIWRCLSKRLRR